MFARAEYHIWYSNFKLHFNCYCWHVWKLLPATENRSYRNMDTNDTWNHVVNMPLLLKLIKWLSGSSSECVWVGHTCLFRTFLVFVLLLFYFRVHMFIQVASEHWIPIDYKMTIPCYSVFWWPSLGRLKQFFHVSMSGAFWIFWVEFCTAICRCYLRHIRRDIDVTSNKSIIFLCCWVFPQYLNTPFGYVVCTYAIYTFLRLNVFPKWMCTPSPTTTNHQHTKSPPTG